MSDKVITVNLGYGNQFTYKEWEIIKSNYGGWYIVTHVKTNNLRDTTIKCQKIHLSKWRLIRNFQMWMLNKIFKPNNIDNK